MMVCHSNIPLFRRHCSVCKQGV